MLPLKFKSILFFFHLIKTLELTFLVFSADAGKTGNQAVQNKDQLNSVRSFCSPFRSVRVQLSQASFSFFDTSLFNIFTAIRLKAL